MEDADWWQWEPAHNCLVGLSDLQSLHFSGFNVLAVWPSDDEPSEVPGPLAQVVRAHG